MERTILELTKRSRHQWEIFTSHYDADSTYPEFKEIEIIELRKVPVDRSYPNVLKAAWTILFQKIDMRKYDALWVVSEGLGDFVTFRNHEKPVICLCYTPLKVIHDPFMRKAYLEKNRKKKICFTVSSKVFRFIDRFAWRNYHHVFTVSKEVRDRILRPRLTRPENIEIIYGGVDTEKIRPTWNYEPYFYHPTRIKWWKNVELSIKAFSEFKKRFPDLYNNLELIIAGQVDKGSRAYYQTLLDMIKGNNRIKIIANPPEQEMKALFENCYTVLNTTLNEDWGLVPLEAMAYGKPVIAVDRGGPKESIIHNKTGLLVEPAAEKFADAMATLAEDKNLVLKMGREARGNSLRYDWDNFVKIVDDYLDRLLTRRRSKINTKATSSRGRRMY